MPTQPSALLGSSLSRKTVRPHIIIRTWWHCAWRLPSPLLHRTVR